MILTPEELAAIKGLRDGISDLCGGLDFFTPTGRDEDGGWSVHVACQGDAMFLSTAAEVIPKLLASHAALTEQLRQCANAASMGERHAYESAPAFVKARIASLEAELEAERRDHAQSRLLINELMDTEMERS